MKAVCIGILLVVLAGCIPSPAVTTTAKATLPPIPALSPTPTLPRSTPSLPQPFPTPQGALWEPSEQPPEYARACAAAFQAGGEISQPLVLPGYVATVIQRDFDALNFPAARLYIPDYEAYTFGEVKALVCIQESRVRVGTYVAVTPDPTQAVAPAYRLDWQVRVIAYPQGSLLAVNAFTGEEPLFTIQIGSDGGSENYGEAPSANAANWLNTLAMANTPSTELGEEVAAFHGASDLAESDYALAFSSDSRWLAVGLVSSGKVDLFSLESRSLAASFPLPEDDSLILKKLVFTPDGSALVAATGSSVERIDLASGEVLNSYISGGSDFVLDVSQDGSAALICSGSQLVIWQTADGSERRFALSEAEQGLYGGGLSSDGGILFAADGQQIFIRDARSGATLLSIPTAANDWFSPMFIPGSARLAVYSCSVFNQSDYRCEKAELQIWDATTGKQVAGLRPRFSYDQLVMRPDGRLEGMGEEASQGYFWEIWDTKTLQVSAYRAALLFPSEALRSPDDAWVVLLRGRTLKLIRLE